MEEEEEDDIYAQVGGNAPSTQPRPDNSTATNAGDTRDQDGNAEDEEEGEEVEEEESDSDIDIITERKGDSKTETLQAPRPNALKAAPSPSPRALKAEQATARKGSPAIKSEAMVKDREIQSRPGSSYPAVKTSNLHVDAKPIYEPNGKPITEIDMDSDFPEDDKPWRRPGTDMTDYFNYGFDEFTWASYCLKQTNLRKEVTDSKKQMEEMQNFLTMPGGMPPMPGMAAAPAPPGMGAMGGPTDLPPEMQQMMQQMMAQGIDPMQMDPATMMQVMQQGATGGGGGGGGGDGNQNFGGQGYVQQGQNQQHLGYGGGGGGGGGYGGGRNAGGRGQGRRW